MRRRSTAAGILATVAFVLTASASASAATYVVDTSVDTTAGNCTATPADCPLRRAVTIANGTMADDEIILTTDVQLNLSGAEENGNASGDIDVSGSSNLTIRSDTGVRKIDKSGVAGNIRIIDAYSPLTLEDVEITGGNHTATPGIGGGGIHFTGFDAAETLRLDNVHVHDNLVGSGAVQAVGGGVSASGLGEVEIVGGSRIEDNFAANAIAGSNGAGGGVAVQGDMDLTVTGSTIDGNRAGSGGGPNGGSGGGIYFFNNQPATANLVVTNSQVTGNRAGSLGSAGTFYFGGGIYAEATGGGAAIDVALAGGSVSGNFVGGGSGNAQGQGGGVYASVSAGAGNGELTADGVTITGNRASGFDGVGNPSTSAGSGFGGGISTNADTTITGSRIEDNLAGVSEPTPGVNLTGVGAGIYALDSALSPDLILNGTTIESNIGGNGNGGSSAGGAISSFNGGALTLSGVSMVDNESKGGGGGISRSVANAGAADSVTSSTIAGNRSGFQGGGLSLETPRLFTISRSLMSGNQVTGPTGHGGAISARSTSPAPTPLGKLRLVNSTVTGNSAGDSTSVLAGGGGLALGFGERIDFESVFSTISSNTLVSGISGPPYGRGGNIRYFDSTAAPAVSFVGTIVSGGSTSPGFTGPNCALGTNVTFTSNGGNLEGVDAGGAATNTCGFTNTGLGDQTGADPLLAPLADNGGPTRTRALPPGSPALNAVPAAACSGVTTDQRGFARPYPSGGACDAGAYELGDRDNDGLLDTSDGCPTEAGPPSNNGCPTTPTVIIDPPPQPTPPSVGTCPKGKKPKVVKGKRKCVKKKKKKRKKKKK